MHLKLAQVATARREAEGLENTERDHLRAEAQAVQQADLQRLRLQLAEADQV